MSEQAKTQREKDTELLLSAGWKRIGSGGHKYGRIEYWDHPDHNDGTRGAIVRGEALRIQKDIDRQWANRNRGDVGSVKTRFA